MYILLPIDHLFARLRPPMVTSVRANHDTIVAIQFHVRVVTFWTARMSGASGDIDFESTSPKTVFPSFWTRQHASIAKNEHKSYNLCHFVIIWKK